MSIITDFVKILVLKRYSRQTMISYKSHLLLVQNHFKKPFKSITDRELFEFVYYQVNVKKISASYQRQMVGSIKLFYREIYNRALEPKKKTTLGWPILFSVIYDGMRRIE